MKRSRLGAKYVDVASLIDQAVAPTRRGASFSRHSKTQLPQSLSARPRCSAYQARSRLAAGERKKIPPIPVTRFIRLLPRAARRCVARPAPAGASLRASVLHLDHLGVGFADREVVHLDRE